MRSIFRSSTIDWLDSPGSFVLDALKTEHVAFLEISRSGATTLGESVPVTIRNIIWNGERLFQASRFKKSR